MKHKTLVNLLEAYRQKLCDIINKSGWSSAMQKYDKRITAIDYLLETLKD